MIPPSLPVDDSSSSLSPPPPSSRDESQMANPEPKEWALMDLAEGLRFVPI